MKKGATRYVFFIGGFAFKIPSLYNYHGFLLGLLSNMQEVRFSKVKKMKRKLCPINFYIPLGFLVVMPKVRILIKNELSREMLENFCSEESFSIPSEFKHDSFGYYKGKLVCVDYGS